MWRVQVAVVFLFLLPHSDSHAQASKTEIYDAPDIRIEAVDSQVSGFYVSKSHDLRLRCAIRLPSSVRLSENTRQIVWRYNEEDVIKAGLPQGTFQVDRDTLLLKASVDAELLVGKYSCNVTWPTYGSVLSPPIQVQLATLKKFKGDPSAEERVVHGHNAYLPCHVPESLPGPAKIWFVINGSKEIIFSHDRYFLTPTGLQIGRVDKSDRGTYVCRAMNPVSGQSRAGQSRDSKPIELVVLDEEKPSVPATASGSDDHVNAIRPSPHLNQRNILDARKGDNVTLECVMVSGPGRTASVRWEKYGRALPPAEKRKHVLSNMILLNVTKEDEGTYICRGGTNGDSSDGSATDKRLHSATSQPRYIMYSLRVYDPLRAKLTIERDSEEDKSAASGLAYRLTCQAAAGLASDLEFWVNGRPLLSQPLNPVRTKFQSGESPKWSFTLTESTLRKGVYQCLVRGRGPFDDSTVDSDNLYVDSSFVGKIPGEGAEDWSTSGSSMDESAGVTRAFDLDQAVVSSRRHPPKIKIGPENETTTIGSSVTFVCQVSSYTDVVYWLKDGEKIVDYDPNDEENDDELEGQSSRRYKRIGTGSLNIETTVEQDRGWYTCVAMNLFGNATAKAFLDFEGPIVEDGRVKPGLSPRVQQTNSADEDDENEEERSKDARKNHKKKKIRLEAPSVFRYSNTSVHLRWKITSEQRRANAGIRFFKLQYRKMVKEHEKESPWKTLDQELPSHSHSGTIDGLEPGQKYKFRYAVVYDNNDQALSKMSAPYDMAVERKQTGPKMAPTLTSVKAISWSAISVSWDYPAAEQAPVDGFIIIYRRLYYADTSAVFLNETVIGGWTREHVLSHLLPATLYQIKMVAFNAAGRSRESNTVEESSLSTDGTRPPRTFDGAGLPDRAFGAASINPMYRADGNVDMTVTGSESSSPPAYANRTDKSASVLGWLNMSSETLFYVIGGVLGSLFLVLIIFMIICTVKQRKQKKLNSAAQGKYRDASKKIYREQALCNDRTVMKEMYPPISNSTSFQHSTTESVDDDHDGCPPPPPAPSQSTSGLARAAAIPPPPSVTGYANGSLRPGVIMNVYTNPLDYNDGEGHGKRERMAMHNRTAEFEDGEESDELLAAGDRLLLDAYQPECDLNKNDVCYGMRGLGGLAPSSTNGRIHRPAPPPLILTAASALTSAGPFATSFSHNVSFLSSSPHASVASNYSSSNAGDGHSSSTNGGLGSNNTPLLPPPMFAQQLLNGDLDGDGEKPKRIPTPIPAMQHSQKGTSTMKSDSSSRAEKRAQHRLDEAVSMRGHQNNGGLLNGAASPMSVSSHASIGSGSAASGSGSRPNFSTFKPDPNRQDPTRHRNNLLLYRNRLSDGYCSDT